MQIKNNKTLNDMLLDLPALKLKTKKIVHDPYLYKSIGYLFLKRFNTMIKQLGGAVVKAACLESRISNPVSERQCHLIISPSSGGSPGQV